MTPVSELSREQMVRAAAERRVVLTRTGRIGRLARWDTMKRPGKARVLTHADTGFTVKCCDVLKVELDR